MTEELPNPTLEIERARFDLRRHGYCILRDAIPDTVVAALRSRTVEQARGELASGAVDPGSSGDGVFLGGAGRGPRANRRVWTLVNKGAVFRDLLAEHKALDLIGEALGRPFLLSGMQANFVAPGDDPLPLHSDQGYLPRPWPPYAMTANVIWMLDDFTPDNGATTVIPGTHLGAESGAGVDPTVRARLIRSGGVPVCGPAGSALVFDGRIVHGTGVNTTDRDRVAILTYFCRPFIRQQENFTLSVAPEVYAALPESVQALLGFGVWKTLGSVEGVGAEDSIVRRPDRPIGALDATGRPKPDYYGLVS